MSILSWLRSLFRRPERSGCCLACDSPDIVVLGPDAYRCSSCGHEGGDGLGAYLVARKRVEIEAMPPDQRLALARRSLDAAKNLLVGIDLSGGPGIHAGDVALAVASGVAAAAIGVGVSMDDAHAEEMRQLGAAYRDLCEAEQLLDEAATALSDSLRVARRISQLGLSFTGSGDRVALKAIGMGLRDEFQRLYQVAHG